MRLFITDKEKIYNSSNESYKVLYNNFSFFKTSFLNPEELNALNLKLNYIEYKAAEYMLSDLNSDLEIYKKLNFSVNDYLGTRKKDDQLYTLLYTNYWTFFIIKYGFELCIREFYDFISGRIKITNIKTYLSEEFKLLKLDNGSLINNLKIDYKFYSVYRFESLKIRLKNIFYFIFSICSAQFFFKPINKRHVVLFLYDIPSIHSVLKTFIELVKADKTIHLSIIEVEMGVLNSLQEHAEQYKNENISVYNFKNFKCYVRTSNNVFFKAAININKNYFIFKKSALLNKLDLKYAWTANIFEKLNPDICLYSGVLELGRVVSDVSRYYKIPSVNVEYGIFSNDPYFMESNIEFTYKACISENSSRIWKYRKDPSLYHKIIGFCKLDSLKNISYNKINFYSKFNLNIENKTIFFASSWQGNNSSNNLEKRLTVENLSRICVKNNWNLIIKKHPAENDNIVENEIHFDHQIVLNHNDVNLYELMYYSDFVCTQFSTVVFEAMYMNKPYAFISQSNMSFEKYSPIEINKDIECFTSFIELERYLISLFSIKNETKSTDNLHELKTKYLFSSDGQASKRLLEMLK